jgi:hypothetical protein
MDPYFRCLKQGVHSRPVTEFSHFLADFEIVRNASTRLSSCIFQSFPGFTPSLYALAVNRLGQKLRDKRGMRGKSPGNTAR